ncbi:hypothetical protein [Undibacterium sp. TJN19]
MFLGLASVQGLNARTGRIDAIAGYWNKMAYYSLAFEIQATCGMAFG